ncbi:DNA primase [Listeria booriae]|uniref:DNA primase family protein n=1 Tax=Listeria booriae TaxID=1552123 RepID=UPI0016284E7A|nr:phage/plasmid primase, P4 family [Listeria booriae]MBC1524814.1 DNA primase [Listeria booriae]
MYVEYLEGAKHPTKNADVSESLDHFRDAGYLLSDNDLIIDIDSLSHNQIEELIRFFRIKTQIVWTDRGAHLYFKKPDAFRGAKGVCGLGFEVEYKHLSNTKSITIKRSGVTRTIENNGMREDMPAFFKKIRKGENLLGFDEGDGRNQALFKHRGFIATMSNWSRMITFINQTIFAEPLPEKEMETLLRDVNITAKEDGEALIADLIMREKHVVKYSGAVYYFDGHEYVDDKDKLTRMVFGYCPGQKTMYVKEVIEQMNLRAKLIPDDYTFDIKLENGILRNGKFIEIDYKDFTPYSIPIKYDSDTEPVEEVDAYLNHLTDTDEAYRKFVLEMMGHCLIVDKEVKRMMGRFFILIGSGGNGKGTLLSIIRAIFNQKNCSGLSIKNMTDERYFNVLQGKLTNLGDDIQDEPINGDQMKVLKNISTCDFVEMRKLYSNAKSIELTPTLIFTSNHILKSFEKGDSYKRRVSWMPMFTQVKKKDKRFISKLTSPEALQYWIKLIVEAYFRLYENGEFTKSTIVDEYNKKYHEENDTTIEFVNDLNTEDIIGRRAPEVYGDYETWAEENGLNVQSKRMLRTTLKEILNVDTVPTKINGSTQRVYQKIE